MIEQISPRELPQKGAVGGIDVGWSQKRASSAVACLSWDETCATISVERFRATDVERSSALSVFDRCPALAVAIDGPLCTGFLPGIEYRFAERMLTLGFQPLIGKPGQLSSPNGRKLNEQANLCAKLLVSAGSVGRSIHHEKIHNSCVVEAFPTSFLGLMLPDPRGLKTKKRASSDVFYTHLEEIGVLQRLTEDLLAQRRLQFDYGRFRNHDERAAIICALTALCISTGRYYAVGDSDGWIILPPAEFIQPWARKILDCNFMRLEAMGIQPLQMRKLGLSSGMYASQSPEEFNAPDEEIAESFLRGGIWPEIIP